MNVVGYQIKLFYNLHISYSYENNETTLLICRFLSTIRQFFMYFG